ncbi:hypothetical protein CSC28_4835 [Pseudomonas paraeruginosa]|nr:hypothetical protein CSC28_4835 [Pseudomonas paraeruginosa]
MPKCKRLSSKCTGNPHQVFDYQIPETYFYCFKISEHKPIICSKS